MIFKDTDFIRILRLEAESINFKFKNAQIEGAGTPQEISDRREVILKQFFEKFYPFPYKIAKGNVIDSFDNRSPSIDILILNPKHPHTVIPNSDKYSLILVEGVDAAIELKPILKGEELKRALSQGVGLKKLRRASIPGIKPQNKTSVDYVLQLPYIIFSTESYANIYDLMNKIVEFYEENKVHQSEQFDIICINNKCVILNSKKNGYINFIPNEGFSLIKSGEDSLAYLLLALNMLPASEMRLSPSMLRYYIKSDTYEFDSPMGLNERLIKI